MNYHAIVSYDGAKFFGWQRQPNCWTVQEAFEKALLELDGRNVAATASGRTDAGVHAVGQSVSFEIARQIDERGLALALNAHLPDGISVIKVKEASADFNARFNAKSREYKYFIWHSSTIYPHMRGRVCWLKGSGYDWSKAQEAAKLLLGSHDFRNFCHFEQTEGKKERNTVRTVLKSRLQKRGNLLIYSIEADGFLYNMVRIIVGNLEQVALGRIAPNEILDLLDSEKNRSQGGRTFSPEGLYFWRAKY